MIKASKFLTDHEKTRIEQAVADAESNTTAEIVPAIASASGRYDRPEDIAGLWFGATSMAVVWTVFQLQDAQGAQWGAGWSRFELPLLIATLVVGFIAGAFLATHLGWLRRVFTPRKEMNDEVRNAASRVFFDSRVHHTEGGTGILIYISLFEHSAVIMADRTVLDTLGQTALDELCVKLIGGIKSGDLATAVCEVIADAGQRLGGILPRTEGNPNEIENTLILID